MDVQCADYIEDRFHAALAFALPRLNTASETRAMLVEYVKPTRQTTESSSDATKGFLGPLCECQSSEFINGVSWISALPSRFDLTARSFIASLFCSLT